MEDVAAKAPDLWRNIGTMLDIHVSHLNSFNIQWLAKPTDCYLAVFDYWKANNCPPFTWETIVEVLESDVVHRCDLAAEIRRKYL